MGAARGFLARSQHPASRADASRLGGCRVAVLSPWHALLCATSGGLKSENSVSYVFLEMF